MLCLMVWSGAGKDYVLVDVVLSPTTQLEILMFHKSSVSGERAARSGAVSSLQRAMIRIWAVAPCCMSPPLFIPYTPVICRKNTKVNFILLTGLTWMILLPAVSRHLPCGWISCMKAVLKWNSMAAYCVLHVTCWPTCCAILQFALQTCSHFWYWLKLVSSPG